MDWVDEPSINTIYFHVKTRLPGFWWITYIYNIYIAHILRTCLSCLWQVLTSGAEGDPMAPESSDAIIRSCLSGHHGTTETGPIINTCDSSLTKSALVQLSIYRKMAWSHFQVSLKLGSPNSKQLSSCSHSSSGPYMEGKIPIFRHTRQSQMPALPFAKAANYLKLKGSTPGPRSPCGYCVGALSIWGSAKSSRVRGSIFWHVMLVDSWF